MRCVLALAIASAVPAVAAPTTWEIDQPWEFYTSNTPPQTRLVGSITFDRDISNYYPSAWSFYLVHFDPVYGDAYPITIEGTYPSVSDSSGFAFTFRRDLLTAVVINFGAQSIDSVIDGTLPTISFSANEYVQVGPFSSQRIINNGTATLVPAPAGAAVLAAPLLLARRRRG